MTGCLRGRAGGCGDQTHPQVEPKAWPMLQGGCPDAAAGMPHLRASGAGCDICILPLGVT